MLLVLFRSRKTEAVGAEYQAIFQELLEAARQAPGFVDFRSYRDDESGETLAAVWWEDPESLAAWRHDARHLLAQRRGRDEWYEWYRVEVAEITRSYGFRAPPAEPGTSRP